MVASGILHCLASGFGASEAPHLLAPLQALAWISAPSPGIDAPGRFAATPSTRYEISQCLPIASRASAAPLDLERDGAQRIAQLERGEEEEQRTDEQQDSGHMRAQPSTVTTPLPGSRHAPL